MLKESQSNSMHSTFSYYRMIRNSSSFFFLLFINVLLTICTKITQSLSIYHTYKNQQIFTILTGITKFGFHRPAQNDKKYSHFLQIRRNLKSFFYTLLAR